jgi:hypothetical protein
MRCSDSPARLLTPRRTLDSLCSKPRLLRNSRCPNSRLDATPPEFRSFSSSARERHGCRILSGVTIVFRLVACRAMSIIDLASWLGGLLVDQRLQLLTSSRYSATMFIDNLKGASTGANHPHAGREKGKSGAILVLQPEATPCPLLIRYRPRRPSPQRWRDLKPPSVWASLTMALRRCCNKRVGQYVARTQRDRKRFGSADTAAAHKRPDDSAV